MSSPAAQILSPQFDKIPQELRAPNRWLLWRAKPRTGKPGFDKIPHSVHTKHPCNAHDPAALATFDQVKAAFERGGFDGIGLMPGEGIVGIDLDKCVAQQTGEIAPWAAADIKALGSYTETSPSGTGLRLFVKGTQPAGKKKVGPREIYSGDGGNFLTVTGHALVGSQVEQRQGALDAFHAEHFGEATPSVTPLLPAGESRLSDEQVLRLARNDEKFQHLYGSGDISDYGGDHSAADLALACKLAFYCGRDPEQLERIFSESVLGQRAKWTGRTDYRERTIYMSLKLTPQIHPAQRGAEDLFPDEPGDDPATPESIRKTHSPAVIGFKSAHDMCTNLKPPRYIVKKYIEEETTTVWFGESGNLKSFLALELGVVVAAGQQWAGCDTEQGPTVYLCGEGHGGIARRLAACLKQRGISPDAVPFFVSDTAADFSDTRSVNALTSEIQHLVSAAGPLRLLIVDTLAANFGAGDENSTKDMGLFLQNIIRMRHALGCAALIIHHSGHGDKSRERGAYVLPGGVDARFRIDREGMSVCLRRPLKMKDGEPPPDTWFASKVVQVGVDEDLNPITSLTLTHDPFFRPEAKAVKLGENQQFLADAAANGVTEDELRTRFQAWKGDRYQRQAFHRALGQLKDAGFLVQGPESLWISTVGSLSTCQRGVNEASTVDEG